MFGLGWGEMVVIGIVALIAIGPKELPTVLRTIGQTMAKVRRMAAEFQGQFNEALREAEVADLKKQAEDLTSSFTNFDPLGDTQKHVERALELPDPLASPPPADSIAAAPVTPVDTAPVPDGATLPPGAVPPVDLPPIDVPLPDLPTSVTEKDFAAAEPLPAGDTPKAGSGA
jgi:sec-independent protein translocase protein TatB